MVATFLPRFNNVENVRQNNKGKTFLKRIYNFAYEQTISESLRALKDFDRPKKDIDGPEGPEQYKYGT